MMRSDLVLIKNENGAVLWIVIVISFLLIIIVTSSFSYLLEHRKIIQMRLQQLQANEYVKNGMVFIKNKLALGEELSKGKYTEYYSTGFVEIVIIDKSKTELFARISGNNGKGAIQTYEVVMNIDTHQVKYFLKAVKGWE